MCSVESRAPECDVCHVSSVDRIGKRQTASGAHFRLPPTKIITETIQSARNGRETAANRLKGTSRVSNNPLLRKINIFLRAVSSATTVTYVNQRHRPARRKSQKPSPPALKHRCTTLLLVPGSKAVKVQPFTAFFPRSSFMTCPSRGSRVIAASARLVGRQGQPASTHSPGQDRTVPKWPS